jgi:hypothetical protein
MFERLDQPFDLNLDQDGAEFFLQALDEPALVRLETALAALPIDTPWLYAKPIVHASLLPTSRGDAACSRSTIPLTSCHTRSHGAAYRRRLERVTCRNDPVCMSPSDAAKPDG